jgi:molecular chaperone GrpE (heat shock protein)
LQPLRNPFDLFLQHYEVGKTYEAQNKLKQASDSYMKAVKSLDNVKTEHFREEEETRYHVAYDTMKKLIEVSEFYRKTYPNKEKSEAILNRWNLVFGN